MFLSRSQDEDRMCRRFLESLEESVESCLRKHMNLIDDVYAVLSYLRRYAHLIHKGLDVLYTVVGSRIELMDTIRTAFSE